MQKYANEGLASHSLMENHIANDSSSFDRDEALRHKLIKKNLGIAKKGDARLQIVSSKALGPKKASSKFVMYKRPEQKPGGKLTAYDQPSYADQAYPLGNVSVDASMYRKSAYPMEKKRKGKIVTAQMRKAKHKRSATPSLTPPQQFIAQQFNPNNIMKRKNLVKISKARAPKLGSVNEAVSGLLL